MNIQHRYRVLQTSIARLTQPLRFRPSSFLISSIYLFLIGSLGDSFHATECPRVEVTSIDRYVSKKGGARRANCFRGNGNNGEFSESSLPLVILGTISGIGTREDWSEGCTVEGGRSSMVVSRLRVCVRSRCSTVNEEERSTGVKDGVVAVRDVDERVR